MAKEAQGREGGRRETSIVEWLEIPLALGLSRTHSLLFISLIRINKAFPSHFHYPLKNSLTMRLTGVSAALLLASLPFTIAQHASFHPLSCNENLTVADCNEMTLSSIVADHLNFIASSNTTHNTTTPSSPAVIPCGVCAVADISPESPITAPHGIDVQGMLYVPSSSVGTLETAHMIIQGKQPSIWIRSFF